MGLIMLILIGTVPTAYALNRAMPAARSTQFRLDVGGRGSRRSQQKAAGTTSRRSASGRHGLRVATHDQRSTYPRSRRSSQDIGEQVTEYGSLAKVPAAAVGNTRNDMYLASEAIRFLLKDKENDLSKDDAATLNAFKKSLDNATKFIPLWVKVAVAIALGLGTMVGWKRIVVTVGEKIGKTPPDLRSRRVGRAGGAATIGPPTSTACRSRPRTCCRRASPEPWPRTARACSGPRCATC